MIWAFRRSDGGLPVIRQFLRALQIAALVFATSAAAQGYPSKPLRFIVPFPPGAGTDMVARAIGTELAKSMGQPVVVENIGGAGGGLGMAALARAPADGYTIGLATIGTHAINPHLYGDKLQYDPLKDFTPITQIVNYVNVLVVNPAVPAKTVGELVAYAKANPEKVSFGSSGNGASNHLSGELLKTVTGAPMLHVPYRGGAAALSDVLAGNVTFMFDLLISSLPQVKAGKLRALAVTSSVRSDFAPDVPTMDESGVPGYAAAGSDLWFGIMAPAGLPPELTERLNKEIVRILEAPAIRERFRASFLDVKTSSPGAFAATLESDHAKWGKVVKASGITAR